MRKSPRVLAYGDSLTAGFCDGGASFWPWAPVLQHLLGGGAVVDHIGLSGWTTSEMLHATGRDQSLRDKLEGAALVGKPYTSVIIMAGTNDIGQQTPPAFIVQNLEALHSEAHRQGASSVAMSIPESLAAATVPWLGTARTKTNEQLLRWARAENRTAKVLFVDAAAHQEGALWEPGESV